MTVLCVNNGVTYADIAAADAAVGGTDFGVPTRYEQSGVSSSPLTFVNTDYISSFIYTAKAGEETTGVITVGAQMTAAITIGSISNSVISNLRTNRVISSSAVGHLNQNLVAEGAGQDLFIFSNNTGTDDNCIAHNCSEGWRAGSTSNNHITINCTAVNTTGFGFLRPRVTDTVSLNTSSATYLQEGGSSSNYWADDGNGSSAITETIKTDIFEDYAGGDYRIKASSSVGIAGAGAFINASSGVTVTGATANYNYTGVNGSVDLTGEIIVAGATANYNYTGIPGTITLDSEIIVTGQTANYNYTGIDGSVELTGLITVTGQTANYDYDGIAADVTLQGSIVITGSTANYDYNALNATIILQGLITLNPKNIIRVSRKSSIIRVKRKSNIIRVR